MTSARPSRSASRAHARGAGQGVAAAGHRHRGRVHGRPRVPFAEAASAAMLLLARPARGSCSAGAPAAGVAATRGSGRHRRQARRGRVAAAGPGPGGGEEAGIEPLDLTALGCFHDGDRADAWFVVTAWKGQPANRDRPSTASSTGCRCTRPPGGPDPDHQGGGGRLAAAMLATGHRLRPR